MHTPRDQPAAESSATEKPPSPAPPAEASARGPGPVQLDLEFSWQESPDFLCLLDSEHRFYRVNRRWETALGWTTNELQGSNFCQLVHPDDRPAVLAWWAGDKDGITNVVETRMRLANGSYLWVEWRAASRADWFYACGREITAAKQSEEALRESETLFRLLAEELPLVAVQGYDLDSKIFFWNKASERLYGWTKEEALGQRLVDLVLPLSETEDFLLSLSQLSRQPQRAAPVEMELRHKDGHIVPILTSHLVASQPGAGPQFFCLDLDLTSIKNAEAARSKAQRSYELLYQNMLQGFVILQEIPGHEPRLRDFKIISINPAAERILNQEGADFLEVRLRVLLPLADHGVLSHLEQVLDSEEAVFFEQYSQKFGKWFEVSAFPLEPGKCGLVFSDITERHQTAANQKAILRELRRQKQAAIQSSQAKDEFLAAISHELRTPLNAIIGLSSLLLEEEMNHEFHHYLQAISDAGRHQLLLIEQIIDYTQLDQGILQNAPSPFPLLAHCQSLLREMGPRAPHLNLHLRNGATDLHEVPGDLQVVADARVLGQILRNLLDNACKYTREGMVTLEIGMLPTDPDLHEFLFVIEDTGIGITPEVRRKLFLPFSQGDSSYTRTHGGLGLGLAICGKAVKLLGGDIGVESQAGQGSRFWFRLTLPCERDLAGRVAEDAPAELPRVAPVLAWPLRALVVDHRTENLAVAQALLQKLGGESTTATHVSTALALCANVRFDAILVSCGPAHPEGISLVQILRQEDGPNRDTPVMALTSNADPRWQKELLAAGIDHVLIKPISMEQLYRSLGALTRAI